MRYTVYDYNIEILHPQHASDFSDDGEQITGLSFKDAKKKLLEQLRAEIKEVKEETEQAYLERKRRR